MFINNKLAQCEQQRIQHYGQNSDAYHFFNILTSPELLSTVEALLPEHRERLFPPTETLSMFLAQALSQDRSCQNAVNDAAIKRLVGGTISVQHTDRWLLSGETTLAVNPGFLVGSSNRPTH